MAIATLIHSAEEAEGLIRWSLLFAVTDEDERVVIINAAGVSGAEIDEHVRNWGGDHPIPPEIEIVEVASPVSEGAILDELRKPFVRVAVIGQNRERGVDSEFLQLNRRIFDRAVCDSILIRLGDAPLTQCESILIPSAGGPHSKSALRRAHRIAQHFSGSLTPLYIEPDIGEDDGQAVGHRVLAKVIAGAGLSRSETRITPEVIVADRVGKGIYEAAKKKDYDLILIGASDSLSVKRKLFGMIPEHMLEGDDCTTIAVIRKRQPVGHRVRDFVERFCSLRVPQLKREHRLALFERLQTQSKWNFDFMALMVLATGIAGLGLLQNSPAVVIGAMLVAPLMTPLLGSGLALVQANLPMMKECLKAIILGFLFALAVGVGLGFLVSPEELTDELRARGNPNLLDFGVAALSGLAASHCVARPNLSSALAGVAIAAALVPPIATVGISLSLGEWPNARGAALLFGTNVVAIILSASLAFFASGIRGAVQSGKLWARRVIILLLIALAILMVPLATVIVSKAAKTVSPSEIKEIPEKMEMETIDGGQ